MMENLEAKLLEEEASLTGPSSQQEIERLTNEIDLMVTEAENSPEKLEAVEKKMEELKRLSGGHDQEEG